MLDDTFLPPPLVGSVSRKAGPFGQNFVSFFHRVKLPRVSQGDAVSWDAHNYQVSFHLSSYHLIQAILFNHIGLHAQLLAANCRESKWGGCVNQALVEKVYVIHPTHVVVSVAHNLWPWAVVPWGRNSHAIVNVYEGS